MNDEYQAREPLLQKYYHVGRSLIRQFDEVGIVYVSRADNDRTDVMSKVASTKKMGQRKTLIQEVLNTSSWDHGNVFAIQIGGGN